MKSDKLIDAIADIDEEMLSQADTRRTELMKRADEKKLQAKKRLKNSLWPVAAAACMALVVVGAGLSIALRPADSPFVPDNIYEDDNPENSHAVIDNSTPPPEVSDNSLDNPEITPPAPFESDDNKTPGLAGKIVPLAMVTYPEVPEFPDFTAWNNGYPGEAEWRSYNLSRRNLGKEAGIDIGFYKQTINQFLSSSEGENRVYSPLNFYLALSMLSETADGQTRTEILDLLRQKSIEDTRENANKLWLSNYRDDTAVKVNLASSVWLSDSLEYREKIVSILAEKYYAECFSEKLGTAEVNKKIGDWLNSKTGGLLKDSAQNIDLPQNSVMALYSTIYFKARWDHEFTPSKNVVKTFHGSNGDADAEFMYALKDLGPYYTGSGFSAVKHEFTSGGMANSDMWFILPDEDKTIDDILASGEYLDMIKTISGSFDYTSSWSNTQLIKVHFYLPKFDVSSDVDLSEGLNQLGIESAFSHESADFSGIVENGEIPTVHGDQRVRLSSVRHAARVVIDEEGCEAAAFTEELLCGDAAPLEEEIDFVLDRPFIFVIMSDTNEVLFVGTVYNCN